MKKILKFEAEWCQPCKQLAKVLEDTDLPIEVINVDTNPIQVEKYRIRGVPTLVFLNSDGVEVDRIVGLTSLKTIEAIFADII